MAGASDAQGHKQRGVSSSAPLLPLCVCKFPARVIRVRFRFFKILVEYRFPKSKGLNIFFKGITLVWRSVPCDIVLQWDVGPRLFLRNSNLLETVPCFHGNVFGFHSDCTLNSSGDDGSPCTYISEERWEVWEGVWPAEVGVSACFSSDDNILKAFPDCVLLLPHVRKKYNFKAWDIRRGPVYIIV